MAAEYRSPWDDPNVKAALAEGRLLSDIALIECPECHNYSYYNEGSHFTCSAEGCDYSTSGIGLDRLVENDGPIFLSDHESPDEDAVP